MKNKGLKHKRDPSNDENVTEYERVRKEHIAKNEEYLSPIGLANKEKLDSTKKEKKQKQKASKDMLLPTRRSQRLGRSIHANEVDDTNDHLPNISDDHVQGVLEKMVYCGEADLQELYLKLKQRFECTSEDICVSSATCVVEKEQHVQPSAIEKTPITSPPSKVLGATAPSVSTGMNGFSTPNLSSEHVSNSIKRRKTIQGLYMSTKREAKERKFGGRKSYLIEVIDGQPSGPNASRWATELGTRIRSHLDVTKSKFADQDPGNVDQVIQQMENAFETIGRRIPMQYYKKRMRILMNNFRHKCRKLILDGKDRESSLTLKQWEDLKESMGAEEYLAKSTRAKKARNLVKAQYFLGRGGLRAKRHIFVEGTYREPIVSEMTQYMAKNSKHNHMSKNPIESCLPSIEAERRKIGDTSTVGEDYNHAMKCIAVLLDKMSTIASSIEPLVAAWKKKKINIDLDEEETVCLGGATMLNDSSKGHEHVKDVKAKTVTRRILKYDKINAPEHFQSVPDGAGISDIDSCPLTPAGHGVLHVGDKVNILDPYDGAIAGIGQIQSLSMIHGVALGPEDVNVNVINVTSNRS